MKTQRIIKFRVWDEKYRCWVNNSFLLYPKEEIKIQGRILTQFTGLLDRDGKEIYEGDIIEGLIDFIYPKKEIGKIIFNDGTFGVDQTPLFNCNKKVKIIGNIFENPELLYEKI